MIVLFNPRAAKTKNRRLPLSMMALGAVLEGREDYVKWVIVRGRVRLISPGLRKRWPLPLPGSLERIFIGGVERYVDAPVSRLLAAAREHLGSDFRLGHKQVWQ